jgi:HEAT repeat protein
MLSENWILRNAAVIALASIDVHLYENQLINGLRDREWWVRYNSAKELCHGIPLKSLSDLIPQSFRIGDTDIRHPGTEIDG